MTVTNYGDTANYTIRITTVIDHAGGTSAHPNETTTETLYMICEGIKGSDQGHDGIKDIAGGSSFSSRNGKHNYSITLTNGYIVKFGAYTKCTTAFNAIQNWIKSKQRAGVAPLYMIITHIADATDLSLSQSTAGAEQNYMTGYLQDVQWEAGILFKWNSAKFKECIS